MTKCVRCGKDWPQCLTNDALACMFVSGDMLDPDDCQLLEAEIKKRGLPFNSEADWVKNHKHEKEPCWKQPWREVKR